MPVFEIAIERVETSVAVVHIEAESIEEAKEEAMEDRYSHGYEGVDAPEYTMLSANEVAEL